MDRGEPVARDRRGAGVIALTLPWPPAANNLHAVVRGRKVLSKAGRMYRELVALRVLEQKTPSFGALPLTVQIDAHMPDKRRRDLDNILKAALDSLTRAGVWDDDSQIHHLSIRRYPPPAGTRAGWLGVRVGEVAL
jgi:crossover junction endodeoxyribonuclease RusA